MFSCFPSMNLLTSLSLLHHFLKFMLASANIYFAALYSSIAPLHSSAPVDRSSTYKGFPILITSGIWFLYFSRWWFIVSPKCPILLITPKHTLVNLFSMIYRKLSVGSSTHRNLKASRSVSCTPIVKNAFSMSAINATL